MISPVDDFIDVDILEVQLREQSDNKQRVVVIDQLIENYIFTNLKRCVALLEEQERILQSANLPDFWIKYYWQKALVENQRYNYLESEKYFEKAIDILEERGAIVDLAEARIDFAGTCINSSKLEEAKEHIDKARKILKRFPNQKLQGRATCREAYLKLYNNDYPVALKLFLEAEQLINESRSLLSLKDYYFLTIIHSGLGFLHEQNDDPQRSVKAYQQVVDISEQRNLKYRLSWYYLNVGKGHMSLNQYDEAKSYFDKAIWATDDLSELSRANCYANLGFCHVEKGEFGEALSLFDRAEKIYMNSPEDHYSNLSNISFYRGRIYKGKNEQDTALYHLSIAYDYAKEVDDFRLLSSISKFLAKLYAETGDFESAYSYQSLYADYSERFAEKVEERKERELNVKYEANKKEKEAELLRLQANQLQLKALRAQMNPHFLYNALNAIQNFITSNEVNNAARYLAKFALLMRQSLEYSEVDSIVLEKEIEFIKDYLYINQKLRYHDLFEYCITTDDDIEEDIMCVPTMIIQPYVENAIEHGLRGLSGGGLIKVNFSMIGENTMLCVVEDNGIGRAKARELQAKDAKYQNHKSRGTFITEERLRLLSKDESLTVEVIDLFDEDEQQALGTRVEIQIPIVDVKIK